MFGLQNLNMEKIVTPRLDLPLLQFPRSQKPTLTPCPSLNRLKKRSCSSRIGFETEIGTETESHGVKMSNTVGRKLLGLAAAAAVAVSSSICFDSPALSESITVAFPVSRAREVTAVQRTLVEAWGLIRETFVDPTFNHQKSYKHYPDD